MAMQSLKPIGEPADVASVIPVLVSHAVRWMPATPSRSTAAPSP
jgi:hypothetical protein